MIKTKLLILSVSLLFAEVKGFCQGNISDSAQQTSIYEILFMDIPYYSDAIQTTQGSFFSSFVNPSMNQSLCFSASLYNGVHDGISRLFFNKKSQSMTWVKRLFYNLTVFGADFILTYSPGFNGWLHEEYHRSVMTRFHVNSFDDMNLFPVFESAVSVSHVKDEDLIRFKKESAADFIRMNVAGIEGEYLLVDKLEKENFFYEHDLPHEYLYLFSTLNSISYVQMCSQPEVVDPETDNFNLNEPAIEERDFTGFDFLAWTYDLFRPDEDYTKRGIHPLGNGIDRYIKTTDLTNEELDYLWLQGKLQWLNMISPMIFGIKKIPIVRLGIYANFSVHHFLTSFGNDISCNFFIKSRKNNFVFAYHSYQNYLRSFPALEFQMIDYKLDINKLHFLVSPRIITGFQPVSQKFMTDESAFFSFFECKIGFIATKNLIPVINFSCKANGWVAGNEFLNSNLSFRFGLSGRLYQ